MAFPIVPVTARARRRWKFRTAVSVAGWAAYPSFGSRSAQMLARVAEPLAGLRGSGVECCGSADLVRREASGARRWVMQADQALYLRRR